MPYNVSIWQLVIHTFKIHTFVVVKWFYNYDLRSLLNLAFTLRRKSGNDSKADTAMGPTGQLYRIRSGTAKALRFQHLNVTPYSSKSSGENPDVSPTGAKPPFFPQMSRLLPYNDISDVSAGKVGDGVCAAPSLWRFLRLPTSSSRPRVSSPDKPLHCRCGAGTALTSEPPSAPTKRRHHNQ